MLNCRRTAPHPVLVLSLVRARRLASTPEQECLRPSDNAPVSRGCSVGIRDWLSGRKNPTADWVRDPNQRLAVDVARGTLCGVAFGEPIGRVAFLGPTERVRKECSDLEFLAQGVSVGISEGLIESYSIWWQDYLEVGFTPYAGSILRDGEPLGWNRATTENEIVSALGQPYFRDQDDSETILFYEPKDRWGRLTERQIELDENGKLKALLISPEPMLADEATRRSLGIDKPWPAA